VKNKEPTKKVAASQRVQTALTNAGTEPRANSSDPMANRTAIHHPRDRGAHHVEPTVELSFGDSRCGRVLAVAA
jgi:hypothetical protein